MIGSFPPVILEPIQDHLRQVIDATQDLYGAQRSLHNAYGLYLKTRPAASSESVKRARALGSEGPHPALLARLPAGKLANVEVRADCVDVCLAFGFWELASRGLAAY